MCRPGEQTGRADGRHAVGGLRGNMGRIWGWRVVELRGSIDELLGLQDMDAKADWRTTRAVWRTGIADYQTGRADEQTVYRAGYGLRGRMGILRWRVGGLGWRVG